MHRSFPGSNCPILSIAPRRPPSSMPRWRKPIIKLEAGEGGLAEGKVAGKALPVSVSLSLSLYLFLRVVLMIFHEEIPKGHCALLETSSNARWGRSRTPFLRSGSCCSCAMGASGDGIAEKKEQNGSEDEVDGLSIRIAPGRSPLSPARARTR